MAIVKAREIVGKTATVVDVDYREGRFGPEVIFELVAKNGDLQTLTMARNPQREAVALQVCEALEGSPDGVPFTLSEVDAKRSPTGKAYIIKEFPQAGGGGSALRSQYRAAHGIGTGSTEADDDAF